MRKSRFTETQIIGMIKEQEAGLTVAEICRKHGISPASFYKLKAKYGGMDVLDARRLKQLEDENAKLKRLVADIVLLAFGHVVDHGHPAVWQPIVVLKRRDPTLHAQLTSVMPHMNIFAAPFAMLAQSGLRSCLVVAADPRRGKDL